MKEHLRSFHDEKHESSEFPSVNIRLEKLENINNMVLMEKHGNKKLIPLRIQFIKDIQKEFPLTQDSICYLSIINGIHICAIVKHPIYVKYFISQTENRSVVVECSLKSIEKDSTNEDDGLYINLKEI